MKKLLPLALIGGGIALAAGGKKKKKKKSSGKKLNQCDPLNAPEGKECFFDGARFVLRDIGVDQGRPADDPKAMPEIAGDQIAFSKDFETYKIGATWRIKVLDNFLNIERQDGQLLTRQGGASAAEMDANREVIRNRFFGQYNVQTVDGPVTIKDIPPTDAAIEFVDLIDDYTAKFQKMTFS